MATTETTQARKSYKEVNPFNAPVKSAQKLLAASKRRQALYHYLREIKDEHGIHDVSHASAVEVVNFYHQHVGRRSGFEPEQCAHINAELDAINALIAEAYPHFRAA